jgi:hypothetical protein
MLLTQHDALLEGNLYVYVCSQLQLRPGKKKNYHVLAQTVHIALDCTDGT